MSPRRFTEIILKILGLYSSVEGVAKISQSMSLHGFSNVFSTIGLLRSDLPASCLFLVFGWFFLQHSSGIVSEIFDRGKGQFPSPNCHIREWHIALLSLRSIFERLERSNLSIQCHGLGVSPFIRTDFHSDSPGIYE